MMGTRRHGCNDVSPDREGNCEGCVCSLLRRASRGQRFLLLLKGTAEFLALGPGASPQPTEFTFFRFNRETCCATFTFIEQGQMMLKWCRRDRVSSLLIAAASALFPRYLLFNNFYQVKKAYMKRPFCN